MVRGKSKCRESKWTQADTRILRVREAFEVRAYSAAFDCLNGIADGNIRPRKKSGGIRAHSKRFARFARAGSAVPFIPGGDLPSPIMEEWQ